MKPSLNCCCACEAFSQCSVGSSTDGACKYKEGKTSVLFIYMLMGFFRMIYRAKYK